MFNNIKTDINDRVFNSTRDNTLVPHKSKDRKYKS